MSSCSSICYKARSASRLKTKGRQEAGMQGSQINIQTQSTISVHTCKLHDTFQKISAATMISAELLCRENEVRADVAGC